MKKKTRRLLSMFLAVCLLVSAVPAAFAADTDSESGNETPAFSDTEGSWAKDVIESFYGYGYILGYNDGTFKPDNAITREEFMVIVGRVMGIGYEEADADPEQLATDRAALEAQFADAEDVGSWSVGYIAAVVDAGYVTGASNNGILTINPKANITRQEVFVIVSRMLGIGYDESADTEAQIAEDRAALAETFPDADDIGSWAVGYVAAIVNGGYVSGKNNNGVVTISPTDDISRAEVVQVLSNCLDELTSYYVLMNIPYGQFYSAELQNNDVDAVAAATKSKSRSSSISANTFHDGEDGEEILGITFPVKVPGTLDLSAYDYEVVTDDDAIEVTYNNRGKQEVTPYTGAGVLFERGEYAYYMLSEEPDYYKALTVNEDGSWSFGAIVGMETTVLDDATVEYFDASSTGYGDFEIDVTSETLSAVYSEKGIYGVTITSVDENGTEIDYGLRHVENIWVGLRLAWCMGETTSVHGSKTDSTHYISMIGQTITKITYITTDGYYVIDGLSIEVTDPTPEPMSTLQKIELEALLEQGRALLDGIDPAEMTAAELDLNDHLGEIEDLLAKDNPTSIEAEDLLDEVPDKIAAVEDETSYYVLMNIPYGQFYSAELQNNDIDAVAAATASKSRSSSISANTFHDGEDGEEILGITFPVKVPGTLDLSAYDYEVVTDDDEIEVTYNNRGNRETTTYTGAGVLFERGEYAYYMLSEEPDYYKKLTVNEDGSWSFGAIVGMETTVLDDATVEYFDASSTGYGDFEIDVTSETLSAVYSEKGIYGVTITAVDENGTETDYGLRHVENIWVGLRLAWCMGETTSVHGSKTDSTHYISMIGQTITKITYITTDGYYVIDDLSIEVTDPTPEPMSTLQKIELEELLEEGQALLDGIDPAEMTAAEQDLYEHLSETEALLEKDNPTSIEAEELLGELPEKIEAVQIEQADANPTPAL